jgi:DNA helicase-2/ATP-dependent DNA helicase PcrA
VTQQRRNGDRHLYAQRTRFIPEKLLVHFQPRLWAPGRGTAQSRPATAPIDVRQRMKSRWT